MPPPPKLVRTPALWTLYALLGLYAFLQNALGPAVPFLMAEFHLDYTIAALHISAFAVGMVTAGLTGPWVIRRLGRQKSLWLGPLGTLVGLTGLVLAPGPWVSLPSLLFAAVAGALGAGTIQVSISDLAGPQRAKSFLEANIVASATSAVGPFVLVLGTALGTGWRTLWPVFAAAVLVVLATGYRPVAREVVDAFDANVGPRRPLPRSVLRPWLLIFFGVAVEWCVGFWAASYLKGLPGGSVSLAAAGAGVFQLAALGSRWVSSRLSGRFGEKRLLAAAIVVTAVGFPLYWSLANAVVAFTGLVLCGWGAANFFPLALSMTLGASGGQEARASSFGIVASGSAILLAPLALGTIADHWSMAAALLAIPLGLLVMLGLLLFRRAS